MEETYSGPIFISLGRTYIWRESGGNMETPWREVEETWRDHGGKWRKHGGTMEGSGGNM